MLLKFVAPYWVAPLFAAVLSALTLGDYWLVRPHSYDLATFLCFLPMVFVIAALVQAASQKQVRDLQQRIEQLEAKTAH